MKSYPLKRPFDLLFSACVVIAISPILIIALVAVWAQDYRSPFYMARRVARGGGDFTMIKVRSMVVNAEQSGVNSTGAQDQRITKVGQMIRRYKIDELSQFLNVLRGDMSVVGPRPNTRAWGVDLYTPREQHLLDVRPGITDLSSIVFSDEGDILKGAEHADEAYNQLIRPWKSRLGLLYIEHQSLWLDLRIIWITALAVVRKPKALEAVVQILHDLNADPKLIEVCRRAAPLEPALPPGAQDPGTQGRDQ